MVATFLGIASGGLLPVVAGAATAGASPLAKVGARAALPAGATVGGSAPATQKVQIAVGLKPTDEAELTALADAVSEKGSIREGRYLSKGQFAARFGASTAEIGAVRSDLKAAGLDVTGVSSDHLLIEASGTVSQVDAAFHTSIDDVTLPGGRAAFANTSAPELSGRLAADVVGVSGLSDVSRAVPEYRLARRGHGSASGHAVRGSSGAHGATPNATSYTGTGGPGTCTAETAQEVAFRPTGIFPLNWTEITTHYGFNTAYRTGDFGQTVTVGIFELSPYTSKDLATFDQCVLTSRWYKGGAIGTVTNVAVDGGAGHGAGTVEPILDVEDVQALAPEADIVMYEAPNTTLGVLENYDTMVADDQVQVISTSWGQCEPTLDPEVESLENLIFQEAAVQGQTVFSAAGDRGSTDCHNHTTTITPTTTIPRTPTRTTLVAVDDPASQPYVTGVGGTTLTDITPVADTYQTYEEAAWGTVTRKIGGGGGVSQRWAKPAWQATGRTTAAIPAPATPSGTCTPTPAAQTPTTGQPTSTTATGSCRQVPDVVANANPTIGGVMIYCKGEGKYCTTKKTSQDGWEDIGGTSDAAPEWAALTALADKSCEGSVGFINPRLYSDAASGTDPMRPVLAGTNDVTGTHPGRYTAKSTAPSGYNDATGLGSPTGARLIDGALCPTSVSGLTATIDPGTAGALAHYSVHFDTSTTGALSAGETVTLAATPGTVFPPDVTDYTVNGVRPTIVSPTFTGTSTTFNAVVVTLPATVAATASVTVAIDGVYNPPGAGMHRIYGSTSGDAGTMYTTFALRAGPASVTGTTVTAATPSALVSGPADKVTVTVVDTSGNPVDSVPVELTVTSTAAPHVSGTGVKTADATGQATFTVTASAPVAATFSAQVTTTTTLFITQTASVDFSELDVTSVILSQHGAGESDTLTIGVITPGVASGSTITLTAPPGATLPSALAKYHLTAGGGPTLSSVALSEGPGSTTDNRAALVTGANASAGSAFVAVSDVTNPTAAGTYAVTVATTADPVPGARDVTVTAGTVDPATSSVAPAYPSAPSDGLSVDMVTVTARDRYGNPVGTLPLGVTATGEATVEPFIDQTGATGTATFGVVDPTAQLATVTVTSTQGLVGSTTISFSGISAVAYDVVTSLTTFAPDTTAGATVDIEAYAELSGGVKPGGWVTFTAPPGTQLPGTGADYGLFDTFNKFQTATLTVSKGPGSTTTNVVTFTLADTAKGLKNNASFAVVVALTVTNPLHPGSGRASLSASGPSDGVPAYSNPVTFTVGPVSGTTSGIVATPPVVQVGATSTVTVSAFDADENPVTTLPVTLHATAGASVTGSAPTTATAVTGADGKALFSVTDDAVATVQLSATVGGTEMTGSVRFAHGSYVSGVTVSPTTVPAGGASTYTVRFTTSATGALAATATVMLVGPTGTAWPSTTASYTVTGQAPSKVSGSGTAQHPLVLTLAHAAAGDSATATVTATHVGNPTKPSTGDVLTVATSADITPTPSNTYSVVAVPTTGYDMVGRDGGVFVFNTPGTTGGYYGSLPEMGITPVAPIVGMVPTADDGGYFLVGADGGVFAFGNAPFLGSSDQISPSLPPGGPNSFVPTAPIVGIVAMSTDKGYFLVGEDGGVFAFGTAPFLGSLPSRGVATDDVVGIAATPSGDGYWVITATGTVTAFGAARTLGPATGLGSPVAAIAGTPTGGGYWVVAQDGAVKAFGNATDFGTLPALHVTPNLAVVGIVPIDGTGGYWLIGATGGIYAFGHASFLGSLPGLGRTVSDIAGAVPN